MGASSVFLIFFLVFAAILLYAGWITRRWVNDSSDYILAGREVSLLINVFGVAAIGFAGTSIALGPGLAISYGLWGSLAFAAIYSLGGLALYGLLFTPFIRRSGAQTLPEWLETRFSPGVRTIVTVTTIIGLAGITANNVVSMAGVVSAYAGWSLPLAISLMFALIIAFSYFSGLWAVTLTDFIQMIIGLVAIPLFLFFLISKYGGFDWLGKTWPGPNLWVKGFAGQALPIFSLQYPSVLTFVVLFAVFLVWGNNYYWLRASSCRSERVARWSYVWAGFLLILFIFLPLALIGLYAAAAYPKAFLPMGKIPPVGAYGYLLRELPPVISAFALIGALAASISTAATAVIGATSVAIRDLYQRIFRPHANASQLLVPSRIVLLLFGLLVWLLCFYPGGPVYLFAFANAWLGPPSLLVLLGLTWPRFTAAGALWGTVLGMGTMFILTFLELTGSVAISRIMHVGIAGLLATAAPAILISFVTKPHYYGQPGWSLTAKNRSDVDLQEIDRSVLEYIRHGYNTLAEITDALGVDARVSAAAVARLDQGGYIERYRLTGSGFYSFRITEKGEEALPPLSEWEKKLAQEGLQKDAVLVLKRAAENPDGLTHLLHEEGWSSLVLANHISHLVRLGFLKEGGIWRRNIMVTDKGRLWLKELSQNEAKDV